MYVYIYIHTYTLYIEPCVYMYMFVINPEPLSANPEPTALDSFLRLYTLTQLRLCLGALLGSRPDVPWIPHRDTQGGLSRSFGLHSRSSGLKGLLRGSYSGKQSKKA